jgi:hypothetical protein
VGWASLNPEAAHAPPEAARLEMMDPNRDEHLVERESDSRPGSDIELGGDNDQDSHVSPSDNDGETVPEDEVVGRPQT